MKTRMKFLLTSIWPGTSLDARLNLTAAIGSTVVRQVLASGMYFVAVWIITRQLGPVQNGLLATVLLLPQTLYAFLNLGLGASHIYHLSSGSGNHLRMRSMNWLLAAALWGATVILLGLVSEQNIGKYLPGIEKSTALRASALFPMMLLASWTSSLIQGRRDYLAYNKTLLVQPLVFCVSVIFLRLNGGLTVESVLLCYILSQMSLWFLSETKVMKFARPVGGEAHRFADSLRFGLRAHISNVITFMHYRVALYLVSYLLGAAATGKYALSVQLAEVLWLISSAASMIVFPESAAYSKSPVELQKMVSKIARSVVQITFAGAVLAAALSPFAIPWIFGADYKGSVMPFLILLPGIVIWSYMSIISNSLAGMGYQMVNVRSALLCLLMNVSGDLLAIPRFGANGAALASTIAFTITTLYTAMVYQKIMADKLKPVYSPNERKVGAGS